MSETHELRLKIDAAAAKSGSREFTAAVDAVKRAVRDLERDSSGVFKKLRKEVATIKGLGKVNVGVDKAAIRDLQSYAAGLAQISKSAGNSTRSVTNLGKTVRGYAEANQFATKTANQLAAAILKTNSGLMRQIQLASQARSAIRQVGTAPSATAAPAGSAKATSANTAAAQRAARTVEASQLKIQRSIATSRTAVEGLTTSLMKMGGFGAMNNLHRDFARYQQEVSKAGLTTKELAAANDRFAASLANARTSVTTLRTVTAEETRAAKEAASAEQAAAAAVKTRASASLSASAALRSAETETTRLTTRLRDMGDTRGITALNQALIRLKAALASGNGSTLEVRKALDAFKNSASGARNAIIKYDAAQRAAANEARRFAQQERDVANSARAVEREMRSLAGANNAVRKSWADATGNMRGLENAFRGGFQAASIFRTMIGSITLGSFAKSVYDAGNALQQFNVSMQVATGSASGALKELEYVDNMAAKLGINLKTARDNYSKFSISASIAGVESAKTQKIFESVSTALSVLGKGTEDQNLSFLALEQMMSKGCHAPGSLIRMADGSVKVVEEIKPGEQLMGPDGAPRTVIALAYGVEEMYRVDPTDGGESFVVNLHHKLRVLRNGKAETLVLAHYLLDPERDNLRLIRDGKDAGTFSVESVGDGEFHGFLISDDHLYVDAQGYEHHNTVSSEELRRQLGERLPGAVNMMAQALGVTVTELQKMLKAGSIASADALPKFAKVLEERFGPGLEQASRRAGNNIQKFQNQVTHFLETVANSGLMDELAVQFRKLTDVLASGEGADAARKLGEGLAQAAKVGGQAALFLATHLDQIGAALKAIGIGIVVRQMFKFGAAINTGVNQLSGYAAAALSAKKNTDNLTTATKKSVISQEAAARAALTTSTRQRVAAASTNALGAAFVNTSKRAMMMSRAFSVLAPIAGVAVTALMMFPGVLDSIGLGSDKMATRVEAAVSRSGVAFDEFGQTLLESPIRTQIQGMTDDILLLQDASDKLGNSEIGKGTGLFGLKLNDTEALAAGMAQIVQSAFSDQSGIIDNVLGGINSKIIDGARMISGKGVLDTSGVSKAGAMEVVKLNHELQSLTDKQGDAIKLQEHLNKTMQKYPSLRPYLEEMDKAVQKEVRLEAAIEARNNSLVKQAGSDQDRALLNLAEQGKQVIDGKAKVEDFKKAQEALIKTYPQLADKVGTLNDAFTKALAGNQSSLAFLQKVSPLYSEISRKMQESQKAVEETAKKSGQAIGALEKTVTNVADKMGSIDLNPGWGRSFVSDRQVAQVKALMNVFEQFQNNSNIEVSMGQIAKYFNSLGPLSDNAREFTQALRDQFGALPEGARTFKQLDGVLQELAPKFGLSAQEAQKLATGLLDSVRPANQATYSVTDLKNALDKMNLPKDLDPLVAKLLEAASAAQDAGNKAQAARAGHDNLAEGIANAGGAADTYSPSIWGMVNALQALFSLSGKSVSAMGGIVSKLSTAYADAQAYGAEKIQREQEKKFKDNLTTLHKNRQEAEAGWKSAEGLLGKVKAGVNLALTTVTEKGSEILVDNAGKYIKKAEDIAAAKAKADRASKKTGSSKNRIEALGDESRQLKKLAKDMNNRIFDLNKENDALKLLASGQASTMEGAQMLADAQRLGGGEIDKQTAAIVRQYEAAVKLNKALQAAAKDPVKEWMDSVPNWEAAGKKIEMGVIDSLKGSISDMIKTGKFDIKSLGDSILGVFADVIADKATKELMTLFGQNDGSALSKFFQSLGFQSVGDVNTPGNAGGTATGALGAAQGGAAAAGGGNPLAGIAQAVTGASVGSPTDVGGGTAVTGQSAAQGVSAAMSQAGAGGMGQGGAQAAQQISQAMIQAGQQVAQQISQAMTQGGAEVRSGAQQGLQQGSTQVRTAGQTGLTVGSTQIRTAAMQGGNSLNQGVVQGSTAGAPILAQGVMMGAAGGGGAPTGGGGLLSSIGGWFSAISSVFMQEGGYATNPTATTTMPAAAFHKAPHYAEGTHNTSGIPAVLHPNEAVIPLSKGRKIPVDLGDSNGKGGGKTTVINQTFHIQTNDADSFRKSKKQVAADMATAGQQAVNDNR